MRNATQTITSALDGTRILKLLGGNTTLCAANKQSTMLKFDRCVDLLVQKTQNKFLDFS